MIVGQSPTNFHPRKFLPKSDQRDPYKKKRKSKSDHSDPYKKKNQKAKKKDKNNKAKYLTSHSEKELVGTHLKIFVFNGFHVEANGWDCGHEFIIFQLEQNGRFASSVQA